MRHPYFFLLQITGSFIMLHSILERGRSSGVEHYLAKVRAVSSNLIARSNISLSQTQLTEGLFVS